MDAVATKSQKQRNGASNTYMLMGQKKYLIFFSFDIEDVVAHWGDVVAHWLRCGGSLAVYQTSGAEVPGSNQASPMHIDPGALQDACVIM